ncbi:MAG: hypothetical protein PVJ86_00025 [Phycisphaerales bacterium]
MPYPKTLIPPMQKFPEFYGGQMGVPGSDSPLGLRMHPDAVVLFVDSGHSEANDNNDGTNPLAPKETVQSAIDSTLLTSHSYILVSGTVAEDVITPDYVTGPNYVTLMGNGTSRYAVQWEGDAADVASLDMRAVGWRVSGFRFYGQTSDACVVLRHTDSGANDIAIRTIIDNCYFDGLTTGLTGLESHGCYDVWIVNCTFKLWNNVANTAAGMRVTTTPLAIPYRNHVIGNVFEDSDNGMIWPSNGSLFAHNYVKPVGYAYTMVQAFNTSLVANPGDDNLVVGNYFGGDYSIAGGYRGGAADEWFGNFSPDIAEAEVADNGIVILPPT